MDTNKKIASRILELREANNYTQEYLAGVLGVSLNTYISLERGDSRFTIERLEKLCDLYDMSLFDLLSTGGNNVHHFSDSAACAIDSDNVTINQKALSESEKNLYEATIRRLELELSRKQTEIDQLIRLLHKSSSM